MSEPSHPQLELALAAIRRRPTVDVALAQLAKLDGSSRLPSPRVRWNAAGLATSGADWSEAYRSLEAALERGPSAFTRRDPSLTKFRETRPLQFRRILTRGASRDLLAALDRIGPDAAAKLRRQGLVTPADLVRAGGPSARRAALAEATGISAARLGEMAHLAEVAWIVSGAVASPRAPNTPEPVPADPSKAPSVIVNVCCKDDVPAGHDSTESTPAAVPLASRATSGLERAGAAVARNAESPSAPPLNARPPRRRVSDPRAVDYANLLSLAGIASKQDLATWSSDVAALVAFLTQLDREEHVLAGRVGPSVIEAAVAFAAAEAHFVRVESGADAKTAPSEPKSEGSTKAAKPADDEGQAEQDQP